MSRGSFGLLVSFGLAWLAVAGAACNGSPPADPGHSLAVRAGGLEAAAVADPAPEDGAAGVIGDPLLCATVDGPEGTTLDVTFRGRVKADGPDFSIVVIPDSQYLARRAPAVFERHTRWIVEQRVARNIVFVTHVGDIVDVASDAVQWDAAEAALSILEDPVLTGLPDGIPYGLAVGNHDQTPLGYARSGADEDATTTSYNARFGRSRFAGRPWFGGAYDFGDAAAYPETMDNHYMLFEASGMAFIALYLEYDEVDSASRQAALEWADEVLRAHGDRHAIVTSHFLIEPAPPETSPWSDQGAAIRGQFSDNANVFLMVSGHHDPAGRMTNPYHGHTIYTIVQDYQRNGSDVEGWLRLYTFSPARGEIHVETYGTERGARKTDDDNDFVLPFAMDAGLPWEDVATIADVPAGERVCASWPGLARGTVHEWRVTVDDGTTRAAGPIWGFATVCETASDCDDGDPCTTESCSGGICERLTIPGCCLDDERCDDGDPCTVDVCADGFCEWAPLACDDGNACTKDGCAEGLCTAEYTPVPGCCDKDLDCDDGRRLTIDACDGVGVCSNEPTGRCGAVQDCGAAGPCSSVTCDRPPAAALLLDGVDDRVGLGTASGLLATAFTVECWFRRAEGGQAIATGSGGIMAWPLVAKGGPEADGTNVDMNWFLGIASNGAIAADFEEGEGGAGPLGRNHPSAGTTVVPIGEWHHAAATYDGACWRLYLDGVPEVLDPAWEACPAAPPRSDNVQHAGIGAAMNQYGQRLGAFAGAIDEVRVWSRPRTPEEIAANVHAEITAAPDLLGRWGLNEGAGGTAHDSSEAAENGTLAGGAAWLLEELADVGEGDCRFEVVPDCCARDEDCDDGDPCTVGDACADGACVDGVALDCDDNDPCTVGDACVDGACVDGVALDCDDGDACTVGDACVDGACVAGVALDCDDDDPCTVGDACVDGACVDGVALDCDDGDACTVGDACVDGACVVGVTLDCDDGDACTVGDGCVDGACVDGVALDCDDGEPCTTDGCDPATGCVHAANALPCDDGDACTVGDACSGGACVGGAARPCNDGDPCTTDACDPSGGCVHEAHTLPCDDGDPCTVGDVCGAGGCAGSFEPGCCRGDDECALPATLCDGAERRCVPVLCRSCLSDAECGAVGNRCTEFPSGAFCTVDCGGDAGGCPGGQRCQQLAPDVRQCVPVEGDCVCVPETAQACFDGDVVWLDSCLRRGAVAVDCAGNGCVNGACCPDGTFAQGDACVAVAVEPAPDAGSTDDAGPDVTEPDVVQPDVVQPDVVQPDVLQPDVVQPDSLVPDAAADVVGADDDSGAPDGADPPPVDGTVAPDAPAEDVATTDGAPAGDNGPDGAAPGDGAGREVAAGDGGTGETAPPGGSDTAVDPEDSGSTGGGGGDSGCSATAGRRSAPPWLLFLLVPVVAALRRRGAGRRTAA